MESPGSLARDKTTHEGVPAAGFPRYRRLQRNLILITSVTAIAPLLIVSIINYHQDQKAYLAETQYQIARNLSTTKRTIKYVIDERRAALSMIIHEQSLEQLSSDERLMGTLRSLKSAFGSYLDLGLIDKDGNQLYYAGPYDLKGKNYKDQDWFAEVVLRGEYVSDVFMGHRNFPHFVIAFKHELPDGDYYVLRTTIDMELLNRQIYSLDLDRQTDVFLINQEGILQSKSAFYGDILKPVGIRVPPHSRQTEVIEHFEEDGVRVTSGYAYIENSPFILMVLARQQSPFGHWWSKRSQIAWFVLISIALILLVVVYSATHMAKRLRIADQQRVKIFHNAEYTSKMATIGRLAAGVAHEINNPLAIINEKAGLLKDMATYNEDFPKKEKILALVDSIESSVGRCGRVAHRLLGFARRMDVKKELIDLGPLLKEVVGFQTTEAAHRAIEVTYHIPDTVSAVESDRGQLQQVFLNLISNAFAAVEDGGKVDISVAQLNSNEVAITISDDGTGIPKEDLEHIFEPFYSTKGAAGTGLGLSITRDIVEKLGGIIDVKSKVDVGTKFIVNLPVEKV